jgi:hypothetical protein
MLRSDPAGRREVPHHDVLANNPFPNRRNSKQLALGANRHEPDFGRTDPAPLCLICDAMTTRHFFVIECPHTVMWQRMVVMWQRKEL